MTDNMQLTQIWAIRDARGINRNEKLFLMIVESRGTYTRSAAEAYKEMDMKRDLFEKTRDSLVNKKLLWVKSFPRQANWQPPNHYRVNIAEVEKLVPVKAQVEEPDWMTGWDAVEPQTTSETPQPVEELPQSDAVSQHDHAAEPARKRTNKRTEEENMKENQEERGSASASQQDIKKDKEDQDQAASAAREGSLIWDNPLTTSIALNYYVLSLIDLTATAGGAASEDFDWRAHRAQLRGISNPKLRDHVSPF